jgi:hypothetical protein
MRQQILAVIFSFIVINCFGQIVTSNFTEFDECETEMFFVQVEQKPIFSSDTTALSGYFNQLVSRSENLKNFSGKIFLGIVIFEDGRPCCKSFSDLSGAKIDPIIFKDAVNKMPYWTPAKQQNIPITFVLNIILQFKEGHVVNL